MQYLQICFIFVILRSWTQLRSSSQSEDFFSRHIYTTRPKWTFMTRTVGRRGERNSAEFLGIQLNSGWRSSIWPIRNQGYATRCLGKRCFFWRNCHELWFRSTHVQSMEFSWIPGNSADTPAAGIQLNSREFGWIPWIEKEKPGGFDQICYVSKSFVVKFTTTTEEYKRKRRWKNTNLDWTT